VPEKGTIEINSGVTMAGKNEEEPAETQDGEERAIGRKQVRISQSRLNKYGATDARQEEQ
jgi:hypothetical protein